MEPQQTDKRLNPAVLQKLIRLRQESFISYFAELSREDQKLLEDQILSIDEPKFHQQLELLQNRTDNSNRSIEPWDKLNYSGNAELSQLGWKQIIDGKVACLCVAGGQGTRLGFSKPKGCFPITLFRKKSLFQLLAEKVNAASMLAERPLYLAIMTSTINHPESVKYFIDNERFGLSSEHLDIFPQSSLPLLSDEGNLLLENPTTIAIGPDGNGACFQSLYDCGILCKWRNAGVEKILFIVIDNPLANPFDQELVGFSFMNDTDVTIKAIQREGLDEQVGVLVKREGVLSVCEYSELPHEYQFPFSPANISLFCFSLDFVASVAKKELPLHLAYKRISTLTHKYDKTHAWKFERFVFDCLSFTNRAEVLIYPREKCFAPLKNKTGNNSVESVQKSLQKFDRITWSEISGNKSPDYSFELDPKFYFSSVELKNKWKNQTPNNHYQEP